MLAVYCRESSLARINFIKSRLVYESFSDLSKDVDLVSQEILLLDTRFAHCPANKETQLLPPFLSFGFQCRSGSSSLSQCGSNQCQSMLKKCWQRNLIIRDWDRELYYGKACSQCSGPVPFCYGSVSGSFGYVHWILETARAPDPSLCNKK